MRAASKLVSCALVLFAGCAPPARTTGPEEAALVEAIEVLEPDGSNVRLSHYSASPDGRVYCGLARIDGRVANFAVTWDEADLSQPPDDVQLTRSIDNAPNRQEARDAYLPTLIGIMETCQRAGASLRPGG